MVCTNPLRDRRFRGAVTGPQPAAEGHVLAIDVGLGAVRTARRAARVPDVELSADLDAASRGNEAAFTRVFRAVQPGLLRYLRALVGPEAEDVAGETWAQVCRDLATF